MCFTASLDCKWSYLVWNWWDTFEVMSCRCTGEDHRAPLPSCHSRLLPLEAPAWMRAVLGTWWRGLDAGGPRLGCWHRPRCRQSCHNPGSRGGNRSGSCGPRSLCGSGPHRSGWMSAVSEAGRRTSAATTPHLRPWGDTAPPHVSRTLQSVVKKRTLRPLLWLTSPGDMLNNRQKKTRTFTRIITC